MDKQNNKDYLEHWGILGMHWGIRRYQNKDGSLTEEGKKRYSGYNDLGSDGKPTSKSIEKRMVSETYDKQLAAEAKVYSGVKDTANNIANVLPTGNGKHILADYSKLTDDELANMVKRLSAEKRLRELTDGDIYVKSGSEKAREILQTVGAFAGIGVSVMSIMQGLKAFKESKPTPKG